MVYISIRLIIEKELLMKELISKWRKKQAEKQKYTHTCRNCGNKYKYTELDCLTLSEKLICPKCFCDERKSCDKLINIIDLLVSC